MPRTKKDTTEVLDALFEVFRQYGYEGASLTRISEATGLQRASLYHRFPGGKEEMARAVLGVVESWLGARLENLTRGEGEPAARVRSFANALGELYDGGAKSCLLDALSFADASTAVRADLRGHVETLLSAFRVVAREAGIAAADARRRSEDAFIRLQGSLVLSRTLGEPKPFRRTMRALPTLLTSLESEV